MAMVFLLKAQFHGQRILLASISLPSFVGYLRISGGPMHDVHQMLNQFLILSLTATEACVEDWSSPDQRLQTHVPELATDERFVSSFSWVTGSCDARAMVAYAKHSFACLHATMKCVSYLRMSGGPTREALLVLKSFQDLSLTTTEARTVDWSGPHHGGPTDANWCRNTPTMHDLLPLFMGKLSALSPSCARSSQRSFMDLRVSGLSADELEAQYMKHARHGIISTFCPPLPEPILKPRARRVRHPKVKDSILSGTCAAFLHSFFLSRHSCMELEGGCILVLATDLNFWMHEHRATVLTA